eukprot:COSAG01_NODE_1043_length_11954_cov_9.077014_11_plen_101_part_00
MCFTSCTVAIGEAATAAGGGELLPASEGAVAPTAGAGASATALGAENGSLAAACEATTALSQFAWARHGVLIIARRWQRPPMRTAAVGDGEGVRSKPWPE